MPRSLTPKKELLPVIVKVQRYLCAYCHDKNDGDKTSGFCDCKYGGSHVGHGGHEDNGCPEMREAVAIIGALTDKEYERISNRLLKKWIVKKSKKVTTK